MSFRETLLAAARNQQQKSSESSYYKARFDPPKKEQKHKDKLSVNIQKFLAQQEHEKKKKDLEAQRKREELIAMRDPKALRKIQKTLKVIKSANKSVIEDAVDPDNTAVTREGPDQPDQDDYGYESKESAAIYEKMMKKYSKIPDEPKFPLANHTVHKDLKGTMERVKHALQHEDDPIPHKRKRKRQNSEREATPPKAESDKKKDEPPPKPKIRKPMPPPMDFNQLLKIAEQKQGDDPLELAAKKVASEPEKERPMTKKQKQQYEEEMARRQRRQERMEAEKGGKRRIPRDERPPEREKKPEPVGFGRIPKVGEKAASNHRSDSPKSFNKERHDKDKLEKLRFEKEKAEFEREKAEFERKKALLARDKTERDEERLKREKLDKLKAEKEKIEREMKKLESKTKLESKPIDRSKPQDKIVNRSREKEERNSREPIRHEMKKSIDLKSQNTYRIDKNSNEKKLSSTTNKGDGHLLNGHSSQGKPLQKSNVQQKERGVVPKLKGFDGNSPKLNGHAKQDDGKKLPESKGVPKRPEGGRPAPQAGPSKPKVSNSFDFDKHVNSLGKNGGRQFPPGDVKRKPQPDDRKKPKRRLDSESEYDSEMDDFIDDGDENMDYSKHIKEIFGYDKSRYADDDDDPNMESSFAQQQREEYLSKKHGIMEDLEDMRMEALLKKKAKKKRTLSDD